MLTGVVLNVGQFPVIEREATDVYEAVRVKPDHDIQPLVAEHFPSTVAIYQLSAQLRELAPGVDVIVPVDANVQDARLLAIGTAATVDRLEYQTDVPGEVEQRLVAHTVADGDDAGFGPYGIAVLDDAVEELVLVTGAQRTYLADRRLLAGSVQAAP